MRPVLAYWKIRLLAQPIRLLLHYVGVDFEDKYYERGPAPEYHKKSFRSIKHTLGFDFPDLPYYIDDDVKLTQSNVILRYLGRKHNLYGDTEEERCRADLLVEEINEVRSQCVDVCYYNPQQKAEYLVCLKERLTALEKFIGKRPFFAGEKVTFADFLAYEFLDEQRILMEGCLVGYDALNAFLPRIEAFPAIKKYMESNTFLEAPINSGPAVINNWTSS